MSTCVDLILLSLAWAFSCLIFLHWPLVIVVRRGKGGLVTDAVRADAEGPVHRLVWKDHLAWAQRAAVEVNARGSDIIAPVRSDISSGDATCDFQKCLTQPCDVDESIPIYPASQCMVGTVQSSSQGLRSEASR